MCFMRRDLVVLWLGVFIIGFGRVGPCAEAEHNFSMWEKEIAAFEQMDRTNPPPKDGVLFSVSSTIRRSKTLAQDFPAQQVHNRRFGGSVIIDITYFTD